MTPFSLQESVSKQRKSLSKFLGNALREHKEALAAVFHKADDLNDYLRKALRDLPYSKYIYALDKQGVQITPTIFHEGMTTVDFGRDRSQRPYMKHMLAQEHPHKDFELSAVYISKNQKRPSVTAIQAIRNEDDEVLGYLGVDYDIRELPPAEEIYEEPRQYRQIKGDPAIRSGLFLQQRVESHMDRQLDSVMAILQELMLEHGVHHCQIHYSSSRVTVWHVDDPFVYRILTMDELSDMSICLAYPRRPYPERAIVPKEDIMKIFKQFSALRFADRTIYLRSGSLNLINGFIGLNFSCDGTHYLIYDEFLQKGLGFWFGVDEIKEDRQQMLDDILENLCQSGCKDVNQIIHLLDQGEVPSELSELKADERHYIHKELKSIMSVYEAGNGVCAL